MPIGIYDLSDTGFSTRVVHFKPGDLIYMFSDGFADQFGGQGIKKFKYSSFRQVIQEIQSLPVRKRETSS